MIKKEKIATLGQRERELRSKRNKDEISEEIYQEALKELEKESIICDIRFIDYDFNFLIKYDEYGNLYIGLEDLVNNYEVIDPIFYPSNEQVKQIIKALQKYLKDNFS